MIYIFAHFNNGINILKMYITVSKSRAFPTLCHFNMQDVTRDIVNIRIRDEFRKFEREKKDCCLRRPVWGLKKFPFFVQF